MTLNIPKAWFEVTANKEQEGRQENSSYLQTYTDEGRCWQFDGYKTEKWHRSLVQGEWYAWRLGAMLPAPGSTFTSDILGDLMGPFADFDEAFTALHSYAIGSHLSPLMQLKRRVTDLENKLAAVCGESRQFLMVCSGEQYSSKIIAEDQITEAWIAACWGDPCDAPAEEVQKIRDIISDESVWYTDPDLGRTSISSNVGEGDRIAFYLIHE